MGGRRHNGGPTGRSAATGRNASQLVPNRFLFKFEFPLHRCARALRIDGRAEDWDSLFLLPPLYELDGEKPVGAVSRRGMRRGCTWAAMSRARDGEIALVRTADAKRGRLARPRVRTDPCNHRRRSSAGIAVPETTMAVSVPAVEFRGAKGRQRPRPRSVGTGAKRSKQRQHYGAASGWLVLLSFGVTPGPSGGIVS